MDLLDTWSVRIAENVAPDEVDLAPVMARAYGAGGAARRDLFRRATGNAPGGFGTGQMTAVVPWVLQGMAVAAPALSAMLAATPYLKDFVSIVKDALDIRKSIKDEKVVPPGDRYAPLREAMVAVRSELEAAPLSEEQRDLIVYRVMCVLLEAPAGATEFVQTVGDAVDE